MENGSPNGPGNSLADLPFSELFRTSNFRCFWLPFRSLLVRFDSLLAPFGWPFGSKWFHFSPARVKANVKIRVKGKVKAKVKAKVKVKYKVKVKIEAKVKAKA